MVVEEFEFDVNEIEDKTVYAVEYEDSGHTKMCGWMLKKMIDYCDEPGSRILAWSEVE